MFACDVILGEVRRRRDYMRDFRDCDSTIVVEFMYFCSILFEYSSKLYYMSEGFNMTGEVLTSRALSIVNSLLNTIETWQSSNNSGGASLAMLGCYYVIKSCCFGGYNIHELRRF